jgi:hypothetical protein
MDKKVMLHQGNRFILFILLIFLISCQDDKKRFHERRNLYFEKSISVIGENDYLKIYNNANDSIKSWVDNNLSAYSILHIFKWKLDSLICFNRTLDKCIIALPVQCTWNDCESDELKYFYGAKVNNEWLFFRGGSFVLIRKGYQHDIHKPIPFEKMKDLAMKYIYSGYLKKNENHEWVVNERFFQDLTSVAWGPASNTPEQWDSTYLAIIRRNWEKRDK